MDNTHPQPVIIFEGPDGAGKTTFAHHVAQLIGGRYVHLGPLREVKDLGRIYVEAMLPALLGYQPVVMDRAWFSEIPYGKVFRGGHFRNDLTVDAMLERLVHMCRGAVIYCHTDNRNLIKSFESRAKDEYLDRADQVLAVAREYRLRMSETSLHRIDYDYTSTPINVVIDELLAMTVFNRDLNHKVAWESTGNIGAQTLLVGESYASQRREDTLFQRPFVSFARNGCSYWLTRQLLTHGISEDELCWVNQDQGHNTIVELVTTMPNLKTIIALGAVAHQAIEPLRPFLESLSVTVLHARHPQHHRRFKSNEPYDLINFIKTDRGS